MSIKFLIKYLAYCLILLISLGFSNQTRHIPITISNNSEVIGDRKRNRSWDWNIWITPVNRNDLSRIKYVQYSLHETFPDPIKIVYADSEDSDCTEDRRSDQFFKLCANGWGEFNIGVKVVYTSGYYYTYNFDLCLFNCAYRQSVHRVTYR
jgi:transcription initiation factor IIF auxiliary subunit